MNQLNHREIPLIEAKFADEEMHGFKSWLNITLAQTQAGLFSLAIVRGDPVYFACYRSNRSVTR